MKTTATITFHASHNYGSVLQAYALQKKIKALGYENEIINFRTERQKDLYSVFTKRKGFRYLLKNLSHAMFYKQLKCKYDRFEDFILNELNTTKTEYATIEEIERAQLKYDYYISGSDQIWNPIPADFDWAYYLPFVKGGKKVSYAASFGQLSTVGNVDIQSKIKKYLELYDWISVREKGSADNVKVIAGKDAETVLDPTLLLSAEEWDKVASQEEQIQGKYIFLYTLFATKEIIDIAKYFSKILGLKVVVSNFSNNIDVFNSFVKKYDCGPREFLWYIKNASLILTSSFHGTAFALIYQKPFFSIGGKDDARINTLLELRGLSDRYLTAENMTEKLKETFSIDYLSTLEIYNSAIEDSIGFLRKALS